MEQEFLNSIYHRMKAINWEEMKRIIGKRDVYIWGADNKGKQISNVIEEQGITIKKFLDSDINKQCDNVISPKEIIKKENKNKVFIFISMLMKYKRDILKQLKEADFNENDYFYPCNEWSFLNYEWKYSSVNLYLKSLERGKKVAEKLSVCQFYFLLSGGHIGDLIIALSLLHQLKIKLRTNHISVITEKKYKGLALLYKDEFDELLIFEHEDIEALRLYSNSYTKTHYNIVGADWLFVSIDKRVPFPVAQTMFKCRHLGLDYNAPSKYIDVSYENDKDFKKYIDGTGIEKDNSIILIPYAQSATMLSVEFWEGLVRKLSNKYKIFTNVVNNECAIKGTIPIFIPFEYLVDCVNYAGKAISIRCGVTDVLALGNCDCTVLYAWENEIDFNYAKVTSQYINGKESILYKKAIFINCLQWNSLDLEKVCEHI